MYLDWGRAAILLILGLVVLPAAGVERAFCGKCPLEYPSVLDVCAAEECAAGALSDICPLCASPVSAAVSIASERPLPLEAEGWKPVARIAEPLPEDIFHPPPSA